MTQLKDAPFNRGAEKTTRDVTTAYQQESKMTNVLENAERTLTDFEIVGLNNEYNLADGHAYQDLSGDYRDIVRGLTQIWETCEDIPVPEFQYRFCKAFARLADSPEMAGQPFKICPTASNSIEIVGEVLSHGQLLTRLVEPTFDNLALILWRRRVRLTPVAEDELFAAVEEGRVRGFLDSLHCDALFLVQPNNPTGRRLDAQGFAAIVEHCAARGIVLILDNTFRFYNRRAFNDFAILRDSGVSYMAVEDTGKVWPTHDMKASLLFYSPNLEQLVTTIYNEIYLCHSRFSLAVLERFVLRTHEVGLRRAVWARVDEHRALLRRAIEGTRVVVDPKAVGSEISVEWLNCRGTGLSDVELTARLAASGLTILPGQPFFWHSGGQPERQFNVRLSLMKPFRNYLRAINVFRSTIDSV